MSDKTNFIRWYQTELEIKNDPHIQIPISDDELEAVRKETKGPFQRIVSTSLQEIEKYRSSQRSFCQHRLH